MARQSEQLEREAEQTRQQLAGWLEELRSRVTPGQVIDQLADFAREGAAADFLRNLGREIRENPIPVLLIAVWIGWLGIAASRSPRLMPRFGEDMRTAPLREIGALSLAPVEGLPSVPG